MAEKRFTLELTEGEIEIIRRAMDSVDLVCGYPWEREAKEGLKEKLKAYKKIFLPRAEYLRILREEKERLGKLFPGSEGIQRSCLEGKRQRIRFFYEVEETR